MCYASGRSERLYIAKVVSRFLVDENGPVESLIMRCLKPKVGSGTILEDIPPHLPPDEGFFKLADIIAGPLAVNPLKGSIKFEVPDYENVQKRFSVLKNKNRKDLK